MAEVADHWRAGVRTLEYSGGDDPHTTSVGQLDALPLVGLGSWTQYINESTWPIVAPVKRLLHTALALLLHLNTSASHTLHAMQLLTLLVPLTSTLLALANVPIATVTYDTIYDNPDLSMNNVACSDGPNGLITKGYPTMGSLPSFPYVGGAGTISGWNSESCGNCYGLTYNGTTIYLTAVDYAASGFNIGLRALDRLTGGRGRQLGTINAQLSFHPRSTCGLNF